MRLLLNKEHFTVLDAEGVGACRQILIDDAIQLIEIAPSCRAEPHKPSLISNIDSGLRTGCTEMAAYV